MFSNQVIKTYNLGNGLLNFKLLQSGNLQEIRDENTRINTYVGNNLEPTISNIYLRLTINHEQYWTRLIGIGSPSKFKVIDNNNQAYYEGSFHEINYQVVLSVKDNMFFYTVNLLKTPKPVKAEVFFGLDVAIASIWGVNSNEAYISQYLDHKAFKTDDGYILCTRQNQDVNAYLEVGSFSKNVSYSVDGFQFFGKNVKEDGIPEALKQDHLDNKIYQYEMAYLALQSEKIDLNEDYTITFYGSYLREHPGAVTSYEQKEQALERFKTIDFININNYEEFKLNKEINFTNLYSSELLNPEELNKFYPNRYYEEIIDNNLASFFLENKAHVVLPYKELKLERPSANLLLSLPRLNDTYDFEKALASTNYMYGVFNSQIVYGNTSFNKLMSNTRNPLNLQRITGQRIFIKYNNNYVLLNMPAVYEMGLNYSKWIYKVDDDYLIILSIIGLNESKVTLNIKSLLNRTYDLIITNHLTMSQTENEAKVHLQKINKGIRCLFDRESMAGRTYPEYHFDIISSQAFELFNDQIFYETSVEQGEKLLNIKVNSSDFNLTIIGSNKEEVDDKIINELEINKYLDYYDTLLNHLKLDTSQLNNSHLGLTKEEDYQKDINKIGSYNYLMYWFLHDALCHYVSPHGLEQYNGAAWGTRDVCQGPSELFLCLGHFAEVKHIILTVFSHQFIQTGTFPQWFMFDRYYHICDNTSHGDVVVWTIKLAAMYLEATADYSILDEMIPYMSKDNMEYTTNKVSLFEHLKHAVNSILNNYITGTHLSCYGGGDWDDTLQPANPAFKKEMVSAWTVELTYETFSRLAVELDNVDLDYAAFLKEEAKKISKDFQKYLVVNNIPAGFARFHDGKIDYIIHPTDDVTGMKYRLLPLTRGIISGLLTGPQKKKAYKIIKNHLLFPDGVRLMDKSVPYNGGIKTYFSRAETAANFGREISLQYCHAHIRYCEALQIIGDRSNLFNELLKINPIIITDVVANAEVRQRNSYFSSSDGEFLNRYEVMKHFNLLKTGKVKVKGGWRVYSSGSGIYLSNFIQGLLGIKYYHGNLLIKPNCPECFDNLMVNYAYNGKNIHLNYHDGSDFSSTHFTLEDALLINDFEEICLHLNDEFYFEAYIYDYNHRFKGDLIKKEIHDGDNIKITY